MSYSYTLINSNGVIRSDGTFIPNDSGNIDWQAYQVWLNQNNTPTSVSSPTPVATCALWQIQAVLTSNQWSNVISYINASNNANLIAFSSHGSNLIPSNSTTLASLAQHVGIDPNTLYDLVSNASKIVIP